MPENKETPESTQGTVVPPIDQSLEITINKLTKEVTLKDPQTGRLITIKANVIESEEQEDKDKEDEEEEFKPLPPAEFRGALEKVSSLGLTWTADRIPRVIAKDPEMEDALFSDGFEQLQQDYPHLPRELSAVIYHALTGSSPFETIVGNQRELKEKVAAVHDLVLTASFRAEFFFKYAIKVPYLETIDWEVVFKTHERNVKGMPAVAYALLLLTFHNTNPRIGKLDEYENKTVAVDLRLVNRLIKLLVDVKTGLEEAQKLSDAFYEHPKIGDGNGTNE